MGDRSRSIVAIILLVVALSLNVSNNLIFTNCAIIRSRIEPFSLFFLFFVDHGIEEEANAISQMLAFYYLLRH